MILCNIYLQRLSTTSLQRAKTPKWWGSNNAGAFGYAQYSFIAIAPRSTLARSGSTWSGRIYELFDI